MFRLLRTSDRTAPLVLRLALGAMLLPHGAQKVFGWFGGHGLDATMGFFTDGLGIPTTLAILAIAAESLGGLGLVVGLLTRVAAFGALSVMAVAAALVHRPYGFFMNWSGQQAGEGVEFHLLAMAMAIALMIEGGGRFSFDRALSRGHVEEEARGHERAPLPA